MLASDLRAAPNENAGVELVPVEPPNLKRSFEGAAPAPVGSIEVLPNEKLLGAVAVEAVAVDDAEAGAPPN